MVSFPWHPTLSVSCIRRALLVGFSVTEPLRLDLYITKRTLIIKHLGAGSYFIKATMLSETIAHIQENGSSLQMPESQKSDYHISQQRFSSKRLARMLVVQGLDKHGSCIFN